MSDEAPYYWYLLDRDERHWHIQRAHRDRPWDTVTVCGKKVDDVQDRRGQGCGFGPPHPTHTLLCESCRLGCEMSQPSLLEVT